MKALSERATGMIYVLIGVEHLNRPQNIEGSLYSRRVWKATDSLAECFEHIYELLFP
jgi:hypothetical protein